MNRKQLCSERISLHAEQFNLIFVLQSFDHCHHTIVHVSILGVAQEQLQRT